VVTHGGLIEPALVWCFPDADHTTWGPPFANCEGARLTYDGTRFVDMELLRLNASG